MGRIWMGERSRIMLPLLRLAGTELGSTLQPFHFTSMKRETMQRRYVQSNSHHFMLVLAKPGSGGSAPSPVEDSREIYLSVRWKSHCSSTHLIKKMTTLWKNTFLKEWRGKLSYVFALVPLVKKKHLTKLSWDKDMIIFNLLKNTILNFVGD